MRLLHGVLPLAAAITGGAGASPLTLTRSGRPAATIVLAAEPTRAARFAAFELQHHLRLVTGATLPIAAEGEPADGVRLCVGDTLEARRLDLAQEQLGRQEYAVRFLRNAVVLVGKDKPDRGPVRYSDNPGAEELETWPGIWDERGTLHAVYEFLERHAGVRWLDPTEHGTIYPRHPTLRVAGADVRRAPFFRYRYAAYPPSESYDAYTGLWPDGSEGFRSWEAAAYPALHARYPDPEAYRMAKRAVVTLFRLRRREGGEICPGNHSLYGYYARFWAPEKGQETLFQGQRPDWFAKGYSGRPPQMCYSSRGLVEQVARDACEFFETGKTYPGAQAGGDTFCVEPMDNDAFCKCEACQAWLGGRDKDSPFFTNGRHSDYHFQFVNEVAKIVGRKHPGKRIVTLAYMTHGAPPQRFRLEPNVLVQFCFACNRLNYDRPSYEHEVALLKEWRKAYPDRDLYLWLYDTFPVEVANGNGFHCFPGFFARTVAEQFRLFREQNVRGVFHCGYGQEVEAYLTYRLMDDPSLNTRAVLNERFRLLYGPAAGPMRAIYDLIERTYGDPASYPEPIATRKREGHHHQTEELAWGWLGTPERMARMADLLEQARRAARTDEQKRRVELWALGTWDYMVAGRKRYEERRAAR